MQPYWSHVNISCKFLNYFTFLPPVSSLFLLMQNTWKEIFLSRVSGSLPETVMVEDNKLMVKKVDDAVNTTFICEVKNKQGTSRNQITTFVIGESVQPTYMQTQRHVQSTHWDCSTLRWQMHTCIHTNRNVSHAGIWGLCYCCLSFHLLNRFTLFFPLLAGHLSAGFSRARLTHPVPIVGPTAKLFPHCQQETVTLISNQWWTLV